MMVELAAKDFGKVLPLYHQAGSRFPLISAVLENRQRGQVFADQKHDPASALVVNNFGFMFYVGQETNAEFDDALTALFENAGGIKPSYLLWYSPPENWQQRLDQLEARKRERVRFEFRGDRTKTIPCPAGFEMRKLDAALVPKTEKFRVELGSRFWSSPEDFEKNGLGLCLLENDQIVSLCYAAAISEGLAEVDVLTDEEYRGQGLAQSVSRQFIRECLAREITPTWDCFAYNTASLRLALKLGFAEVRRYPFYSFNVPLRPRGT